MDTIADALADGMSDFTPTATVTAKPMTRGEFFRLSSQALRGTDGEEAGYLVRRPDTPEGTDFADGFYIRWMTADAFERDFAPA